MTRSGFSSAIFLSAAEPLLTAITSYPASARILRPMFWAVTLSSASSIFLAKKVLEAGRYGEGNLRLNVSQCSHWRLPGYQWSTPSAWADVSAGFAGQEGLFTR